LSTEHIIFTDDEINLLNEGLQFAFPPSNFSILDTLVNIESSIQYLPESIQSSIRKESKDAIVRAKSTFVRQENSSSTKIITTLNSKNCFYVKADKSDTVVILDKGEYDKRMVNLINSGPYTKLNKNSLQEMIDSARKTINNVVTSLKLPSYMKYRLMNSNPRVPDLYDLPKIHKPGEAIRPIVSNIHSALQPLAKWLVPEFKKLPTVEGQYVKNSVDFWQKLGQQTIAED
jgi:hypothetical protein